MIRLTDGSVTLREFTPGDAPAMARLANNHKISMNVRDGFPHPYALEDAERFLQMVQGFQPVQFFAIEFEEVYAGNISVCKERDVYRKSAEIGYFLGEPFWNRGIMTRAVNLACAYGFRELDIIRIHTGVFAYNLASQRVLEKCGFVREGVFRNAVIKEGRICDEVRYARLISP